MKKKNKKEPALSALESLGQACPELLNNVFQPEKLEFQHAVRLAQQISGFEYCSVFDVFVPPGASKSHEFYVRLRAEYPKAKKRADPVFDPKRPKKPHLKIAIRNGVNDGLTAKIVYQNRIKPAIFNWQDLQKSPYREKNSTYDHIPSGTRLSLVAFPLRDRRKNLIGLLKFENKLDKRGFPNRNEQFSEGDISSLEFFTKLFSSVLELRTTIQCFRNLVSDMSRAERINAIYDSLLSKAKTLMLANRGDLVLPHPVTGELIVKAVKNANTIFPSRQNELIPRINSTDFTKDVGKPVPASAFVSSLWKSGKEAGWIPDTKKTDQPYVQVDDRVRSEIAIVLKARRGGRRIGIINLESFTPNYFLKEDQDLLRRFAPYAALILNFGKDRQKQIEELKTAKEEYKNLLNNVTEGVCRTTRDGKYEIVNRSMAKLYGVSKKTFATPENPKGRKAGDFYLDKSVRQELLKRMQKQRQVSFEFEAYFGDDKKEKRTIRQNVRASKDGKYLDTTFTDVTREVKEKLKLKAVMERFAKFALPSAVVHDITTPIYDIYSYLLDLQKMPANKTDWHGHIIPTLLQQFEPIFKKLPNLRNSPREKLDICELLESAHKGNLPLFFEGPKVHCNVSPQKPLLIWGHKACLRVVFDNIFTNARNHLTRNNVVRISLNRRGEKVIIRYQDDGPGFPQNIIDDPLSACLGDEKREQSFGIPLSFLIINYVHRGCINFRNSRTGGAIINIQLDRLNS